MVVGKLKSQGGQVRALSEAVPPRPTAWYFVLHIR